MSLKTFEDRAQILESLLNEARSEADTLRKRLQQHQKIILSSRLIMGHELKKPTTAINGYLDLVCEDLEKTDQQSTLVYARKAREECKLLNELNLFFLELLKLDRAEAQEGRTAVDISDLIEEIMAHVPENLSPKERVKVKLVGDAGKVEFDRDALKLVMLNLVENALLYSRKDSSVWIEAKTAPDKRGIGERNLSIITVKDEGVGIPEESLKRIFSPFVRLREDIASGSGLGLTLVRSLVELNGGDVYIQSAEGQGTTVHLTIPAREDNDEEAPILL